jgi:hypothetical protein
MSHFSFESGRTLNPSGRAPHDLVLTSKALGCRPLQCSDRRIASRFTIGSLPELGRPGVRTRRAGCYWALAVSRTDSGVIRPVRWPQPDPGTVNSLQRRDQGELAIAAHPCDGPCPNGHTVRPKGSMLIISTTTGSCQSYLVGAQQDAASQPRARCVPMVCRGSRGQRIKPVGDVL